MASVYSAVCSSRFKGRGERGSSITLCTLGACCFGGESVSDKSAADGYGYWARSYE